MPAMPKMLDRELWLRFLAAVGGLALAFAAAVFSTATRQAGQTGATIVLASLALLLAGAVGVISVPYLLRRMATHRLRDAMDYQMTREGIAYLVVVLVIGIAALNTGNNLLFIVLSAMLAAVLVSGLTSAWMLRGLSVETALPPHIFAGQKLQARLALRNGRRLAPAFSASVVPPKARSVRHLQWERRVFRFPGRKSLSRQWLELPDVALHVHKKEIFPPAIFSRPEYFPFLPPAAAVSRNVELMFPSRGRYSQEEFGVRTRFPFSFLVKTRRIVMPAERESGGQSSPTGHDVIVYPSVEPTDTLFDILPLITGEFEQLVSGRGHDLYRIRDYVPGDSARHVDWKATARSQGLKVREFTREDERKLRIVFDNPAAGNMPEGADVYEKAVALAASLAWHFAAEHTDLSFAAPAFHGGSDVYDFLQYLALVQPESSPSPHPFLEELPVSTTYNIIFTTRPHGSVPTALWSSSYLIFFSDIR